MKILNAAIVTLPLLLVGSLAYASGEVKFSKQYAACLDKSGGVTPVMVECINAELKVQDARLNSAYKKLAAATITQRRASLVDAQRSWTKFRDANCKFYADPDGGSSAAVEAFGCVVDATEARAGELEKLAR